jgi:flagellar hook assembly protein FlgD
MPMSSCDDLHPPGLLDLPTPVWPIFTNLQRLAGVFAVVCAVAVVRPAVATNVGGLINTAVTWTTTGSPYIVTQNITVNGTGSLTINGGVTVKFQNGTSLLVQGGSLTTTGTGSSTTTFTSVNAAPNIGDWGNITIAGGSLSLGTTAIYYAGGPVGGAALEIQTNSVSFTGGTVSIWHVKWNAIHCASATATLKNLSIVDSFAGVAMNGSTVTIQSSTIDRSATSGVFAQSSTVALSSVTITNSGNAAADLDAASTVSSASGLSFTGNGNGNGIWSERTNVASGSSWTLVAAPWIFTSLSVQGSLTINAGASVQFYPSGGISVTGAGVLTAVGTATSRISFTTEVTPATAGSWTGLSFSSTNTNSRISYATISYGRYNLLSTSTRVAIDHTTFSNASIAGLQVSGSSLPSVINCTFSGNVAGAVNTNPNGPQLNATFNYWGTTDGPSGNGPGAGQSISSWIDGEPWLIASPGSSAMYVNSSTQTNRSFNPSIGINANVGLGTSLTGTWSISFWNSSNVKVKTFTGSGTSGSVSWAGNNDSGVAQPSGTYWYQLDSTSGSGVAVSARGLAIMDRTMQLTIATLTVSPGYFSPNADGVQDTSVVTIWINFIDSNWTLNFLNSANAVVRTTSGTHTLATYTWDGKNSSGVVQPDGVYTVQALATNGSASTSRSTAVVIDTAKPTIAITSPTTGQVFSNVYQSSPTVAVTGTASDANIAAWTLDESLSGGTWTTLATGTNSVNNAALGTWTGVTSLPNGNYNLRLTATDLAGNSNTLTRSVGVGNFSMTQNALQFNGSAGSTITYTTILPFTLTETIVVKNVAGQVVRTLFNGSRSVVVGSYNTAFNDIWNGRNDAAVLVPDGGYFYVATVTDGTHTLTWDLSSQPLNSCNHWNDGLSMPVYDPFNNNPLIINYTSQCTGLVTIVMSSQASGDLTGNCASPSPTFFCPFYNQYLEAGTHSFAWAGTDALGAYRGNLIRRIGVVDWQFGFAKNAVVLFGTKPTVSNLTATLPVFGPMRGTQTVAFDLSSYQNQAVSISVTFENQESLSVLRTINVGGVPPGHRTVTFDGHADNGMLVAPGNYTITVSATDSLGNVARGQILSTIQY